MGALISGNLTSPNCVSVKLPVVQEDIRSKHISHLFQLLPAKRASPITGKIPSTRSHYNTSVQKNGSKRQRQFDFYYDFRLFAIFNLWNQEKISEMQSMGMGILLTDKEEHSLPRTNTLPYPETLT
jgi:hypothetical protein